MKKKYKIYVLLDPETKNIRYVGQTCQTLKARLNKHLRANDQSHRVNWIKYLSNKGLVPEIKLICETDNFETCNELEVFYIDKYKKEGCKLVNMTEGGDGSKGLKHSQEVRDKLRNLAKKRMSDPKNIQNLVDKGKEQWKNATEKELMENIMIQPHRRTIIQCDMEGNEIKEFLSLRQIQRELGFFRANISPCLKGKQKHAYNFLWKYKDDG